MIDGNYEVEVKLPFFGWKKATLALVSTGQDAFEATLSLEGSDHTLAGTMEGVNFRAGADVNLPMGINRFDITGTVAGDAVSGTVATNVGSFELRGRRL